MILQKLIPTKNHFNRRLHYSTFETLGGEAGEKSTSVKDAACRERALSGNPPPNLNNCSRSEALNITGVRLSGQYVYV